MKSFISKQGNIDGLCGLYCLVNAIDEDELVCGQRDDDRARDALRYILEATKRLGLLTSYRVLFGYHWHELIEIFNHFSSRTHYSFKAVPLTDVSEEHPSLSGRRLIKNILQMQGQAILSVDSDRHWVLAVGEHPDGGISVEDPSPLSNRSQIKSLPNRADGVAIIPFKWAV